MSWENTDKKYNNNFEMDISKIVKPSIKLVIKILKWSYRELESILFQQKS